MALRRRFVAPIEAVKGGWRINLDSDERNLLLRLMEASGAVLSRDQLLSDVWGYRDGSGARTVDSHIRSIRRKLGDDATEPRYVRTVRGVGYGLGPG